MINFSTRESERESKDRELFNSIAEEYCRKDLLPASRIARRQRLRTSFKLLPAESCKRVLEVGCGCGFSVRYLDGFYTHFVGVDYADNLIKYAHEHNGIGNAEFQAVNINSYSPAEKFDVIFMIGVLHHFDELEQNFAHIVDLLKPGGWLLANEPQSSNLFIQLLRKIRSKLDRSYSGDQINFSARGLYDLYVQGGLQQVRIIPQGLFSTPFAEVVMNPQFLFKPLAGLAVLLDKMIETVLGRLLKPFSWNLIAIGQKSAAGEKGKT